MEQWKEVYSGCIPRGNYQAKIIYGEETGLIVELKDINTSVRFDFGVVKAVRILDEGIVQSTLYEEQEIKRYKEKHFENVIYELVNGEFENQIHKIADTYWEMLRIKHYLIITMNYNIDIITEWEPEISTFIIK